MESEGAEGERGVSAGAVTALPPSIVGAGVALGSFGESARGPEFGSPEAGSVGRATSSGEVLTPSIFPCSSLREDVILAVIKARSFFPSFVGPK